MDDSRNRTDSQISLLEEDTNKPLPQKLLSRATALVPFLFIRLYMFDWQNNRKRFWRRLGKDFVAGLTVGAMVVPQAMSFASVAGLLPVYGLYNAFVGILPYPIFGTSCHLVPGPTAVMSILVKRSIPGSVDGSSVSQELHQFLSFILAFFAGVIQMILGFSGLGFLSNLVAEPVVSGFTSAAAFLIITTQVPSILGIPSCTRDDGDACTLIDAIHNVIKWYHVITPATPILAGSCLVFLVVYKSLMRRVKKLKFLSSFGPLILILTTIPLAHNLDYKNGTSNTCVLQGAPPCNGNNTHVVMGLCCVPADPFHASHFKNYSYNHDVKVYDREWYLRQIGPISPGLPSFLFPFKSCTNPLEIVEKRDITVTKANTSDMVSFSCAHEHVYVNDNGSTFNAIADMCSYQTEENVSKMYNMTIEEDTTLFTRQCVSFSTIKKVLYSSVMVAFIGYMESMTIAKLVARQSRSETSIRPSNELFALGACNFVCAFFKGYPITGSFSRTVVNADAGATTSLSLLFCASVILICLQYLTYTLAYLPKFTLGAIVFEAVLKLIDVGQPFFLWRTDKRDFVVLMVTFILVLLVAIEDGILIGILLSWLMNLTHLHPSTITQCTVGVTDHIAPPTVPNLRRRGTLFDLRPAKPRNSTTSTTPTPSPRNVTNNRHLSASSESSANDGTQAMVPAPLVMRETVESAVPTEGGVSLLDSRDRATSFSQNKHYSLAVLPADPSSLVCVQVRHDLDFASSYKLRDRITQLLSNCVPKYLVVDVSGAHNLDSTGVHVLDSITHICSDSGIAFVCLGGVNEKLATRIRRSAVYHTHYQELWEWDHVLQSASEPLTNPLAVMIMFETVRMARDFVQAHAVEYMQQQQPLVQAQPVDHLQLPPEQNTTKTSPTKGKTTTFALRHVVEGARVRTNSDYQTFEDS